MLCIRNNDRNKGVGPIRSHYCELEGLQGNHYYVCDTKSEASHTKRVEGPERRVWLGYFGCDFSNAEIFSFNRGFPPLSDKNAKYLAEGWCS